MVQKASVVTPERFTSGFTYQDYIAQIKVNKDRFQQNYDSTPLSAEDAEFFREAAKSPDGPAKVLVIGEDWCPDVHRGMPVMARIAEASGMEMRIFPRDDNQDIMQEFLKDGQFQSIPVFVLYTNDHHYLCHWIERPAIAHKEADEVGEQVKAEMPSAAEQEIRAEVRKRNNARFPAWQKATVQEIRELLFNRVL